jgi:hypothetical protein
LDRPQAQANKDLEARNSDLAAANEREKRAKDDLDRIQLARSNGRADDREIQSTERPNP